jgi:hypothetical protein
VVRRRIKFGWIVAAWAAVVAQALPAVCRGDCGRPCCSEQADCCDPAAAGARADSGDCPLCAAPSATAGAQPSDTSDEPCRCHLDTRQDQPLAPSKGSLLDLVADDLQAVLSAARPTPPQAIGVSREYLAASLAVPIRPLRILFGVWRD